MEQEREGGRLNLKGVLDLYREEEGRDEGKGKEKEGTSFDGDEICCVSKERGRERQREDVWCGVYFGLRKEVWLGTSEGWVWRKGNKLEKKKVEGGVRVMAVVGSQVFFFIFFYFFFFLVLIHSIFLLSKFLF